MMTVHCRKQVLILWSASFHGRWDNLSGPQPVPIAFFPGYSSGACKERAVCQMNCSGSSHSSHPGPAFADGCLAALHHTRVTCLGCDRKMTPGQDGWKQLPLLEALIQGAAGSTPGSQAMQGNEGSEARAEGLCCSGCSMLPAALFAKAAQEWGATQLCWCAGKPCSWGAPGAPGVWAWSSCCVLLLLQPVMQPTWLEATATSALVQSLV